MQGETIVALQRRGLIVLAFLCFFPKLFHLQEYLFFGLLSLSLGFAWATGRPIRGVGTPVDVPLLALMGWVLATVPFAADPAFSLSEWRKFAAYVLVFYWTLFVLRDRSWEQMVKQVLAAVGAGMMFISIYAAIDFILSGGNLLERTVRARSPGASSQWLGTYVVITLPMLSAGTLLINSAAWRRFVHVSGGILAIATLLLSYTRAAWLAVWVQIIIWARVMHHGKILLRSVMAGVAITVVVQVVALYGYQSDLAASFYSPGSSKSVERIVIWSMTVDAISQHPVVGIGFGSKAFATWAAGRLNDRELGDSSSLPGTHNVFLMFALGSGVPALGLFVWFFWQAVAKCLASPKGREPWREALTVGSALMVIGFAVRNFFDDMFVGSLATLFFILLAVGMIVLAEGAGERARESELEAQNGNSKSMGAGGAVSSGVIG